MVIHALFLNQIFAWLLGVAVTPGLFLTFNPNVFTHPVISGEGVIVGVWVDVSVDVGLCVGEAVSVGVYVSEGVGVAQHLTQGIGVVVRRFVVASSGVGVDNAAKIVLTALLIS